MTLATRPDDMLAPLSLPAALELLLEGDFHERWEVAKVLPSFEAAAIAALRDLLAADDLDPDALWFVARVLGEFDDPEAMLLLAELLRSPEEDVRDVAAAALGNLGESAIAILIQHLHCEDDRLLLARTLARIPSTATIPALTDLACDPQAEVRAVAIAALSAFHDCDAANIVWNAASDPAGIVRREAVTGLGQLAVRVERNRDRYPYTLEGLAQRLIPCLQDLRLDVCLQAAMALGRTHCDRAAASLYATLVAATAPLELRRTCARVLGWMERPLAVSLLGQALSQPLPVLLAREAIDSLGRVGTPVLQAQAVQSLLQWMRTVTPTSQEMKSLLHQAIASLGYLGDRAAIAPLIEWLAVPDAATRLHVASCLYRLDRELAQIQLQAIACTSESSPLRAGAIAVLREWQSTSPQSASQFQ